MQQVDTIYTWTDCAWLPPSPTAASKLEDLPNGAVPIALRLGPPVTYRVPEDGEGYPASVRRIFPEELQQAVVTGYDPSAHDALRARVAREATPAPSAT